MPISCWVLLIKPNQKFPCSDGKQSRDFIHVDQVISAIIKTLLSKNSVGEIINIGSGKTIKIKSLINRIKKILLKKNKIKIVGKLPVTNIVHNYGYYIGNYPTLKIKKIKKICDILNSV